MVHFFNMECLISDNSVCVFSSLFLELKWLYFAYLGRKISCVMCIVWFCKGISLRVQLSVPENSSYVFQVHVPDVMQRHVQGLPYSLSIKITIFVSRQKSLTLF